jgi:16S rRNA (cytosine967-C5)-methyltransferase
LPAVPCGKRCRRATVVRRYGALNAVLAAFMQKELPPESRRVHATLLVGAAQLLVLGTPAHAAIDMAVQQVRLGHEGPRFAGLVNAVLRKVSKDGPDGGMARWADMDVARVSTPDWLWANWCATYGEDTARKIAEAHLAEPPLDLSVKDATQAAALAESMDGLLLPTGTLRLPNAGAVDALPGYADGQWWVQDAAAALPVRLLGDVTGRTVADLCAAPGGKSAQMAAAGAHVVSVDPSKPRMARFEANLARLGLPVEAVVADLDNWQPGRTFDLILLDAPCTATGTLRRHPDIALLRMAEDVQRQATRQLRLLGRASALLAPGGTLVFCTCSLEAAEGPALVAPFLAAHPEFRLDPIDPDAHGLEPEWVRADGTLRTLPSHAAAPGHPGLDGFFAARFIRAGQ